jgi:hypothetical protein
MSRLRQDAVDHVAMCGEGIMAPNYLENSNFNRILGASCVGSHGIKLP